MLARAKMSKAPIEEDNRTFELLSMSLDSGKCYKMGQPRQFSGVLTSVFPCLTNYKDCLKMAPKLIFFVSSFKKIHNQL